MASLNTIAKDCAYDLCDGIAWVIIWKVKRSWNAEVVWLNPDTETFEPEDLDLVKKVLKQDLNAVMLNGYYCGYFWEDMPVSKVAAGIQQHYNHGYNRLIQMDKLIDSKEKILWLLESP